MIRKKYTKTIAIALAATTIFQSGVMAESLIDVNSFAVELNQTNKNMKKLEILEQGIKLASAKKVTIKETTSSAVEMTTTADISLNTGIEVEIESDKDFEFQAADIRNALSHITELNVKISGSDFDVDGNLEISDRQGFGVAGWDIFLDWDENEDFYDYITLTVRTKETSFDKDGKTYVIEPLEYTTTVYLFTQGGGSNNPDVPENPDVPGNPDAPSNPDVPDNPEGGTVTTPSAVELLSVEIKGIEEVGNTLSASVKDINGNDVNSDLSYRWYRTDSVNSISETLVSSNSTYKLQDKDAHKYIKLVVGNSKNSVKDISGRIGKQLSNGGGNGSSGGSSNGGGSGSSSGSSSSNSSNISTSINNNATSSNIIVSQGSTAAITQNVDGSIKLVNTEGAPATGWQRVSGTWYLGGSNGQALTGWQQVEGKWYLMNANGAMTTGWQNVGGKWYLMNNSGAMTTGWQKVGGQWYFLQSSGEMRTGWINDNGTWYYLNTSGEMLSNTTVNGYKLGANGAWIK